MLWRLVTMVTTLVSIAFIHFHKCLISVVMVTVDDIIVGGEEYDI